MCEKVVNYSGFHTCRYMFLPSECRLCIYSCMRCMNMCNTCPGWMIAIAILQETYPSTPSHAYQNNMQIANVTYLKNTLILTVCTFVQVYFSKAIQLLRYIFIFNLSCRWYHAGKVSWNFRDMFFKCPVIMIIYPDRCILFIAGMSEGEIAE